MSVVLQVTARKGWSSRAFIVLRLCCLCQGAVCFGELPICSSVHAQGVSQPVIMGLANQQTWLGYQPRLARIGTRLISTWTDNSYSSILPWSVSSDEGRSWSLGGDLALSPAIEPTATLYGGGAATLVADGAGHAYLAYRILGRYDLINRVVVRRGTASASGWQWEPAVVAATQGLLYEFTADTPWLACDPVSGNLYLAYVANTYTGSPIPDRSPDQPVVLVRSLDGGQTWSAPLTISGPGALGSRVEVGASGEVLVCWQDYFTKQVMVRRSVDSGVTFLPEQSVAGFNDNSRVRMPGIGISDNVGRAHPYHYYEDGNVFDFPQMAVDRTTGPNRGTVYMVWAEVAEGAFAPTSGRAISETEPNDTPLTANPIEIGDSFVSSGESERSRVPPNGDLFSFHGEKGQMVGLYGQISERPASSSPYQPKTNSLLLLDEGTGLAPTLFRGAALKDGTAPPTLVSLPRTGRYVIPGASSGGPTDMVVSGLVQEFLPSPGSVARDHRDIVMVASRDGGRTWGPKLRVNDDPPGSDQALPAVAVDPSGRVHVVWMDRRDGPEPGLTAAPYWTVSIDGGRSFRPSLRVGPSSDYRAFQPNGIGDFISVVPDAGGVLIAWPMIRDQWPTATVVRVTELPTSIAVPRFTAEPDGDGVRVSWTVSDAAGITGFAVHRAVGGRDEYEHVASVAPRGSGEHEYVDRSALAGERYRYRLEVQRGASSSWEGPVDAVLPTGISALAFERVGPNPFERETRMVLALPRRDVMDVRVYDVQGHEVRRLYTGEAPAGRHVLAWDGRDAGGRDAAPGVYHLRATGAGQRVTRSIVRIR